MQSVRPAVDTITFDTKEIPMSILKPILILAATLWGALALGGCQQPHSHKDLSGTWKGTAHSINSSGRNHTKKYLVLEVDEQPQKLGLRGIDEGMSIPHRLPTDGPLIPMARRAEYHHRLQRLGFGRLHRDREVDFRGLLLSR